MSEHEMCWGAPLYCEQCMFKYTAVGFMQALKPFVGLFHNGSILSFARVQGIDPESFVCNWIPMQVWSCNHLVPHHCWVEGQPGRDDWRFKPLNVSAKPWDRVKGDNGDMTNPYITIQMSYTGLLGCVPVCNSCNCIAMIIRERQGYYCVEYFQVVR